MERQEEREKVMWYIAVAALSAFVGVLLTGLITAGRIDEEYLRGYRKGFKDGKESSDGIHEDT